MMRLNIICEYEFSQSVLLPGMENKGEKKPMRFYSMGNRECEKSVAHQSLGLQQFMGRGQSLRHGTGGSSQLELG